jgi:hypothetical protein
MRQRSIVRQLNRLAQRRGSSRERSRGEGWRSTLSKREELKREVQKKEEGIEEEESGRERSDQEDWKTTKRSWKIRQK